MTRFLGIDPGLRITGYGCVEGHGLDLHLVEAGVIRLTRAPIGTPGDPGPGLGGVAKPSRRPRARSIADRLLELQGDLKDLLERLKPQVVAVEALFAHYKHPATAIAMGHARGVILLEIRRANLELVELRPATVKRFLTGFGQAKKDQMQGAVQARLGLATRPEPADVADALAIAMCAAARSLS